MAKHVILMRHGLSEANARHVWQGAGCSPLTAEGRRQAEQAGARLAGREWAAVESSDLERSVDTARAAGYEPRRNPLWREGDIGEWEGLSSEVVLERYAEELKRIHRDPEVKIGRTGESPREVADRAWEALGDLASRLDDGQAALVVTHAGLIDALFMRLLGAPAGHRRLGILDNTAFCELSLGDAGPMIRRYNDAAHLGPVSRIVRYLHSRDSSVLVELIRHGATLPNLEGRAQGHSDWGLHPEGRRQARLLGGWIGEIDEVFSSPLGRAAATAEIAFGRRPIPVDGLKEINLGGWEGERWADLRASGSLDGYDDNRHDFRRGGTGETWAEVRERVSAFIGGLGRTHRGRRVAAASHGGAIRAYAATVLSLEYRQARTMLSPLENTSVTQVMLPPGQDPILSTYNVAGHLEG